MQEYGTIIMHVIVHDWIYHIPFLGPWLRRFMGWADKQRRKSVTLFSMLSVAPSGPSSTAVMSDLAQVSMRSALAPAIRRYIFLLHTDDATRILKD